MAISIPAVLVAATTTVAVKETYDSLLKIGFNVFIENNTECMLLWKGAETDASDGDWPSGVCDDIPPGGQLHHTWRGKHFGSAANYEINGAWLGLACSSPYWGCNKINAEFNKSAAYVFDIMDDGDRKKHTYGVWEVTAQFSESNDGALSWRFVVNDLRSNMSYEMAESSVASAPKIIHFTNASAPAPKMGSAGTAAELERIRAQLFKLARDKKMVVEKVALCEEQEHVALSVLGHLVESHAALEQTIRPQMKMVLHKMSLIEQRIAAASPALKSEIVQELHSYDVYICELRNVLIHTNNLRAKYENTIRTVMAQREALCVKLNEKKLEMAHLKRETRTFAI